MIPVILTKNPLWSVVDAITNIEHTRSEIAVLSDLNL